MADNEGRQGGGGGVEGSDQDNSDLRNDSSTPLDTIQDEIQFRQGSHAFINRVEEALEPMRAYNEVFHIIRSTHSHIKDGHQDGTHDPLANIEAGGNIDHPIETG